MTQKKGFDPKQQPIDLAKLEEIFNVARSSSEKLLELPQPQPIKHLLIGSPEVVKSTIHYLHSLGYAEAGDWSPFLPAPNNSEEAMSMLVRKIRVQQ